MRVGHGTADGLDIAIISESCACFAFALWASDDARMAPEAESAVEDVVSKTANVFAKRLVVEHYIGRRIIAI